MSECKSASAASKGSELARDSHQRVVWMNDALPDLRALRALGRRFDLVLLSAVWMHVAPKGRERAFRILSELLGPSGLLAITLRLGGDAAENAARGFHDTSAEELIGYANGRAIALRSRTTQPDLRRPNLKWETLVFAMPDDGTGSLPLLRHVIVNDNKSSTYKLGLLRTLVRLAETAPGLIIERTDDLRGHSIRGRRPVLVETVLAPGVAPPPAAAPIGAGRLWLGEGSVPPTAGRLAFRPSARHPVRCGSGRHPHPRHQRRLRQYREDAGALHHSSGFRVAAHDAVVARDRVAEGGPATDDAFEWTESRYDTSVALERAKQLRDGGFALTCVWSASRIRSSPHIDHCFPWARWRNNDLWNLLPARGNINLKKSDRLRSSCAMADARGRVLDWWRHAWVGTPRAAQFFMEARYYLPGIFDGSPTLEDIFLAAPHQRARLKQDQQLVEWPASLG